MGKEDLGHKEARRSIGITAEHEDDLVDSNNLKVRGVYLDYYN